MQDPNDNVTLPLLDSACKQAYCNFIGTKAFEDDGEWSFEVWCAGWNSALDAAIKAVNDV